MPLHLLDNQLVPIFDLLMTGADDEVFVATKHFDGGFESTNAIVLPLIPTAFIACQCVAIFALDNSFTNSQLVSWQENAWHNTSTVRARHFHEKAHLFVPEQFLVSCKRLVAFIEALALVSSRLPLLIQWMALRETGSNGCSSRFIARMHLII